MRAVQCTEEGFPKKAKTAILIELKKKPLFRVTVLAAFILIYGTYFVLIHHFVILFTAAPFIFTLVITAWFWGWKGGIAGAAAGVLINILLLLYLHDPTWILPMTIRGAIFYTIVGGGFGYLIDTIQRLREAREEIRTLSGLLPICLRCKSIRDENGNWHKLEAYLKQRTGQDLTHGLCPDCEKDLSEK